MKRYKDTKYLVTEDGQVWSERSNKFLKPLIKRHGYLTVSIGKKVYIHRLVAEVYLDNPNNYKCVNHIDSDRTNNNVSNLEWCSHAMNSQHAMKVGHHQKGQINGQAKLTDIDVIEIRRLCKVKEMTHVKIAEKFGVRSETISLIHRRIGWKHLEDVENVD